MSSCKKKIYQNVVFFEDKVDIRIRAEDKIKISLVVNKNQDVFFNESHFVRCAVLKFLRDYDDGGKKRK